MNIQTLPRTTIIFNPFDYPVAGETTQAEDCSEAREWSGEIDDEILAGELATISPLPLNALPEIEPDLFEQVYVWFVA